MFFVRRDRVGREFLYLIGFGSVGVFVGCLVGKRF